MNYIWRFIYPHLSQLQNTNSPTKVDHDTFIVSNDYMQISIWDIFYYTTTSASGGENRFWLQLQQVWGTSKKGTLMPNSEKPGRNFL